MTVPVEQALRGARRERQLRVAGPTGLLQELFKEHALLGDPPGLPLLLAP